MLYINVITITIIILYNMRKAYISYDKIIFRYITYNI